MAYIDIYNAATVTDHALRKQVAVALVKADGIFSDAERHAIGELADAFGMTNAEFGELEQEAARLSLD